MRLQEFKCARCATTFISAEDEAQRPGRLTCPICRSTGLVRLASVYSTVDRVVPRAEEADGDSGK